MVIQQGQIWISKRQNNHRVKVTMVFPNVMVRDMGSGYSSYTSRYLLELDYTLDEESVVNGILTKYQSA